MGREVARAAGRPARPDGDADRALPGPGRSRGRPFRRRGGRAARARRAPASSSARSGDSLSATRTCEGAVQVDDPTGADPARRRRPSPAEVVGHSLLRPRDRRAARRLARRIARTPIARPRRFDPGSPRAVGAQVERSSSSGAGRRPTRRQVKSGLASPARSPPRASLLAGCGGGGNGKSIVALQRPAPASSPRRSSRPSRSRPGSR